MTGATTLRDHDRGVPSPASGTPSTRSAADADDRGLDSPTDSGWAATRNLIALPSLGAP